MNVDEQIELVFKAFGLPRSILKAATDAWEESLKRKPMPEMSDPETRKLMKIIFIGGYLAGMTHKDDYLPDTRSHGPD